MSYAQYQSCIEACHACALTCEHCASSCLREPNVQAMSDCIMLDIDCAEICRLTASYISRGSKMTHAICLTCAEICERCQDECAKYQMDHCKACVEACRLCAIECRTMGTMTPDGHYHARDEIVGGLRQ